MNRTPTEDSENSVNPSKNPSKGERQNAYHRFLTPLVSITLLLLIWQITVSKGNISERVLPSPTQIIQATINTWPELMAASKFTAIEGFLGFLVAVVCGILIGIGLYRWRLLHDAIYPLIATAQMIPLITIAPLFIIWFGFEPVGKVVLVSVFALFPIAIQTYRGLASVPAFYKDVALTCGASPTWSLWHVELRVAADQIFSGLRISAAYVFATAATAEYLGAQNGLGIWLQSAFNSFQTPLIFSATLVIVFLTAILLWLVAGIEYLSIGSTSPKLFTAETGNV